MASFFKPASQKEPEKLVWRIISHSLITCQYNNPFKTSLSVSSPTKIAAFDLDDTLTKPKKGGSRFVRNATSHMWWDPSVPSRLKQLYDEGYTVVVFTNQMSISLKDNSKSLQKDSLSLKNFKDQVTFFLRQLEFPVALYAATAGDNYRKPRTGMWNELKTDLELDTGEDIDLDNSFYVGDAAGREKTDKRLKDHATSDRDLAANLGIKFQTPEEFFLGMATEPYDHPFEPKLFLESALSCSKPQAPFKKQNEQEIVICCGSPGSGKSSFFWRVLQPQGYERVNQDILKTV